MRTFGWVGLALVLGLGTPTFSSDEDCRRALQLPYAMPWILRVGRWFSRFPRVLWQAEVADRRIALTFDDGPSSEPDRMPAVLDELKLHGQKATFFVLGKLINSEDQRSVLRRAYSEGHQIAIHGWSHANVRSLSLDQLRSDYERTRDEIQRTLGLELPADYWFVRTPWGSLTKGAVGVIEDLGMRIAQASIVPGVMRVSFRQGKLCSQYDEPTELVVQHVLSELRAGSIVALHSAGEHPHEDSVCTTPYAAETLRVLLPELARKGYRSVTLRELSETH